MSKQTPEEWWAEDAKRINEMSRLGGQIDVDTDEPPELNEDGSLKSAKEES